VTDLSLDSDAIVAIAINTAGTSDFGPATWREGLDRLVESLRKEGQLNELGAQIAAGELVGYLTTRADILRYRAEHPEIAQRDVVPPIVIVGQARTGTTMLHDLLAQDQATRVPLTWEVDKPCPPPETASYDTDPRIEEVDATLAGTELLIPGFRSMHPLGARLAQECVRITASEFASLIFPTQYRVPSYAMWLQHEADMAPAYRWHRIYLQHLQARHPGERWLLKSPAHIWHLQALLDEYPGALLVQTHRDPLRIIASVSSLQATLRRLASDAPDIVDIAHEWAPYIMDGLNRSMTARLDGTVNPDRVVDVQFHEFLADPFGVVGRIYERFGLERTAEADARIRAFYADHPHEGPGAHQYTWADTGLDEAEWRERARAYQEHFGVESERLDG
jgi:Sulfotransferase family